jgi:hypothetical protein
MHTHIAHASPRPGGRVGEIATRVEDDVRLEVLARGCGCGAWGGRTRCAQASRELGWRHEFRFLFCCLLLPLAFPRGSGLLRHYRRDSRAPAYTISGSARFFFGGGYVGRCGIDGWSGGSDSYFLSFLRRCSRACSVLRPFLRR